MAAAAKILLANGASTGGGGGVPLPSFSFPGMPIGFIVADSTGQNWQLTISSAAVDHTSVEKCAVNPALRWVTYSGGGGGGVTSVAGLNGAITGAALNAALPAATTSLAGTESAADKTLLTYIGGRWENVQEAALNALIPSLTYEYMKFGPLPSGVGNALAANALDNKAEGGGTGAGTGYHSFGYSVYQNMKTKTWAWVWRGKFPTPTATGCEIGFIIADGVGNSNVTLKSKSTLDATHLVLQLNAASSVTNQATSWVVDTSYHDFAVTFDLTSVRVYVDGSLVLTQSTITNLSDFAATPYTNSDGVLAGFVMLKMLYGFNAP